MEFVIIESSKIACIDHIKQYYQKKTLDNKCQLQVVIQYNQCSPILLEFLPRVLINIIIEEYANTLFNIRITIDYFVVLVSNKQLNINHRYYINEYESKINICEMQVQLKLHNYSCSMRECFINSYIRQYHPTKIQLSKPCYHNFIHYWCHEDELQNISKSIVNREQFDNEVTVIIALFNSLHNLII